MTDADDRRRGYAPRAGISALNLILPGLGLLRIGCGRTGLAFLLTPFALIGLVALGAAYLPITSYRHAMAALTVLLATFIAMIVLPALLTWRGSQCRTDIPVWSRWYALTATTITALVLLQGAQALTHRLYQPFIVPSQSMMPMLRVGDRFVAHVRWRGPFRRGDVALLDAADGTRVVRIAGLPGDRVAIRAGVPVINGQTAIQQPNASPAPIDDSSTLLIEQLPGEASSHPILNADATPQDEMPEILVPRGSLFLLGDHRDRSADSRMSIAEGGIGMVPTSAVIGRPLYIYWSSDHRRTGTRLTRL